MAGLFRSRVTAIGTEEDMLRLNRMLLRNHGCEEDNPDDAPPLTLEGMVEKIRQLAQWEGAGEDGFLYEMVTPRPYGEADPAESRYILRREACGLWTASFVYEGAEPFQPEDWLSLHTRCGRIPMLALHASWDFAQAKGLTIFTGGQTLENWDRMAECWLWLIAQYECGYPPEEAVRRLEKLNVTLEREDFDLSMEELLESCMDNLRRVEDVSDVTAETLAATARAKDFMALFEMQARVAETALWETEHNAKWLANLEVILDAWRARRGS